MTAFFACTPEKQTLPAMTHEGRNTIGYFLEDGTLIGGEFSDSDSILEFENGGLRFVHEYSYKKYMGQIKIRYILTLDFEKDSIDKLLYFKNATYLEDYYDLGTLDSTAANFLSIDYQDSIEKIISGTFELNFHNVDTLFYDEDSIIEIRTNYSQILSRGRFDLKY